MSELGARFAQAWPALSVMGFFVLAFVVLRVVTHAHRQDVAAIEAELERRAREKERKKASLEWHATLESERSSQAQGIVEIVDARPADPTAESPKHPPTPKLILRCDTCGELYGWTNNCSSCEAKKW